MDMTIIVGVAVAIAAVIFTSAAIWRNTGSTRAPRDKQRRLKFHDLILEIGQHIEVFIVRNGVETILSRLGEAVPHHVPLRVKQEQDVLLLSFDEEYTLTLTITHVSVELTDGALGDEYEFLWYSSDTSVVLEDKLVMKGAHWFGGAAVFTMTWPVEKWSRSPSAFVSGDSYKGQFSGVQERYWLSSVGLSVFVDNDVPLFVGMNENDSGMLRFIAKYKSPYGKGSRDSLSLHYHVTTGPDIVSVQKHAPGRFWKKPIDIPDERVFRHPIWSTWAKFKADITQEKVLSFAKEINQHGFKNAQLEIDDDWTPHYGDFDFTRKKFPNPKVMVDELKDMGFRVTLWVHPFTSLFSHSLHTKLPNDTQLWMRHSMLPMPSIILWWNGLGSALDLTNPQAAAWFTDQLISLKIKYGIDSFKFDAGESNWLPGPQFRSTHGKLTNPNEYTRVFAEIAYAADTDIRCQEVRAAVRTQHLPIFVRLMDKDSHFGYDNGLKSVIPHVLNYGLIGYPFILPDMIGGNCYVGIFISLTSLPDRELFVRWVQINALLPAMQFSVTPWQFDEEVIRISKDMVQLHERYSDQLIRLAVEATENGNPIIRPIWWCQPQDPVAMDIDSEFLVGDDLLVAPVLEAGARQRDVYLPQGDWRDELRGQVLSGGQWYRSYSADLHELPHFTRQH